MLQGDSSKNTLLLYEQNRFSLKTLPSVPSESQYFCINVCVDCNSPGVLNWEKTVL